MKAMKTGVYKYFIAFVSVTLMLIQLTACTDKEDVDISYQQKLGITAAHLFDDYEPFMDGDFDMSKNGWKLNLSVLVYDDKGILVDRIEKICSDISETLEYRPSLMPGEYTVLSIADFRDGLGGSGYKFWDITNEENLQDISITENQTVFPVVFETLGIDVQNITVLNKSEVLTADIKPVTSLIQVFMSDKDYSGWGMDGYSRFAVLSAGYFIRSIKFKNNIRFENGSLSYKYSEQLSDYNIAISNVYEKWTDKESPTGYCYRALLPEENKGFSFHIQKRDLPQDYYDDAVKICGEFDLDGKSNVLPNIASNKQYVLNMIFDAMQLVAMEMPNDYTHEEYTQKYVNDYNKELMSNMVNTKYENMLGKDEDYANIFIDDEPYDHNTSTYPYIAYYKRSRANHFEQYVATGYADTDFTKCCMVKLLLPDLDDDSISYIRTLLSNRFQPEEEGKFAPTVWSYIELGKTEDDSRYRVVLQKDYNESQKKYVYFLSFVLRTKYL